MNGGTTARPALWTEIRLLLLVAMAVFVYTIVVGILNGTDLVEFDQRRILAHVHGGTLGWITSAVFAASLWLFGEGSRLSSRERLAARWLSIGAVIVFPVYTLMFGLTYSEARPHTGTLAVIVIAGFFLWTLSRSRGRDLSVPHWGFLAALGTSIVGGIFGVLLGLQLATGDRYLPTDGEDAHPATMVVGFLVPVGLAMAEWAFFFPTPPKATRAGIIQMVFPFAGGIILATGILLDLPPLAAIAILLEVIGIVIFAVRLWPQFRSVDWAQPSPTRHGVLAAVSIVFAIGLAQYFVIRYEADFDRVPVHQLLALDHANFIGVMTNSVFAMILAATAGGYRDRRLLHLVFFAVNVGLAVFAVGLLADSTPLKRVATPVMGGGLLVGLALFAYQLARPSGGAPPTPA